MEVVTKIVIRFMHQNEQKEERKKNNLHLLLRAPSKCNAMNCFFLSFGIEYVYMCVCYVPDALPHGKSFACTSKIQRFANYIFMLQFTVNLENTFNLIHCISLIFTAIHNFQMIAR